MKTYILWGLIIFGCWSGYRLNQEGAFRSFKPAAVRVYGKLPIVGPHVKKWAYGRSYSRSKRSYRRGKRSSVSRRKYKKRRRSRRRR